MSRKDRPEKLVEFLEELEPSDDVKVTSKTRATISTDDPVRAWEFHGEECQQIFQDLATVRKFLELVEELWRPETLSLELYHVDTPNDVYDELENRVDDLETY